MAGCQTSRNFIVLSKIRRAAKTHPSRQQPMVTLTSPPTKPKQGKLTTKHGQLSEKTGTAPPKRGQPVFMKSAEPSGTECRKTQNHPQTKITQPGTLPLPAKSPPIGNVPKSPYLSTSTDPRNAALRSHDVLTRADLAGSNSISPCFTFLRSGKYRLD